MKKMNRLFTLALAIIMILSLAAPAFAAEDDFVITITNPHTESSAGHIYEAYQIFSGTLSTDGTTLSDVQWGAAVDGDKMLAVLKGTYTGEGISDDIKNGVKKLYGEGADNDFSAATNAAGVADVISVASWGTNDNVRLFSEIAEACLLETQTLGTTYFQSEETDAPYTIEIPKTMAGYYLVKDQDNSLDGEANKDYTKYILRVVDNTTVQHKGSVPSIDKKVSVNKDSGYGEAIDRAMATTYYYKLEGGLPSDYRDYYSYFYEMTDTMSAGITLGEILNVYVLRDGGATIDLIENTHYTINKAVDAAGTKLVITFNDLKADFDKNGERNDLNLNNKDKIIVVYSATLNENAIIAGEGNPNSVTLRYSNNPNEEGVPGSTPPDITKVYSFKLVVEKVDNANRALKLNGAEFVLYRNVDHGAGTVTEYAVVTGGKVTGWTENENDATTLITNEGMIAVEGLGAATYWLKETKAPDGYEKLLDPVFVTIGATYNETEVLTMTVDTDALGGGEVDVATGTATVQIVNYKGNVLPETGGVGTTMFYLFGGLMAVSAMVLLVTKKRMAF